MDLQEYVSVITRANRIERFGKSAQMSIGDLIKEIEAIGVRDDENRLKKIAFDFGSAIPTTIHSWRGAYDEAAIGYDLSGHDGEGDWENTTAELVLERLKESIEKSFMGYKGGDYTFHEETPLWVANYGNSDSTGIIGVLDLGYRMILLTAYCEY